MRHSQKRTQKPKLPYCPNLGVHHLFFEGRHYTKGYERTLRNFGAFILSTDIARPPQHTIVHRSLMEPPKPSPEQAYDMLGLARTAGLTAVLEQIDTRVTDHLRMQMAILAMPTGEAIDRLVHKMYVTQRELHGI